MSIASKVVRERGPAWRVFTAPDGAYSINMPGEPTRLVMPMQEEGIRGSVVLDSYESRAYVFGVMGVRFDMELPTDLDERETCQIGWNMLAEQTGYRTTASRPIGVGSFRGTEHDFQGDGTTGRARVLIVRRALYVLFAEGRTGRLSDEDFKMFFPSFRPQ